MIVRVAPAVTVPTAQGNAVLQAPLFETKASPVGVGAATDTLAASLGPLLVIETVYTTSCPGVTDAGPLAVMLRSADAGFTGTGNVCASSPGAGSLVTEIAEAVLTIGFAPAYPEGTR